MKRAIAIGIVVIMSVTAVAMAAGGSNRHENDPKIEIDGNGVTFLWFDSGLDYSINATIQDGEAISYEEFEGTLDYWEGAQAYTISFIHVDETSSKPTGVSLKLDENIIDDDEIYPVKVIVYNENGTIFRESPDGAVLILNVILE